MHCEEALTSLQGGFYRGHEGKKSYFAAWERELETPFSLGPESGEASFRQLFRRQAERLGRSLQSGEPYEAFRYPA